MKIRNALSTRQQAQLLTMRDALLVAPHIKGKKGSAVYATARKVIMGTGRKPRNLVRVVNLALKLKEGVKCG